VTRRRRVVGEGGSSGWCAAYASCVNPQKREYLIFFTHLRPRLLRLSFGCGWVLVGWARGGGRPAGPDEVVGRERGWW
jgi:hypothetical protein